MILITRPIDDAVELQQELKKKKILSLIDPLTSFKFQNRKIKFSDAHVYICASQRCVDVLARIKNINNISIIVVGKKVAKRLKENNFKNILFISHDTQQLMKWMRKKENRQNNYVYLSGSIVNQIFVSELKKYKISFKRKVIYETILKKSFNRKTIKFLKQNKINSVVFYSKTSADVYFKLLKKYKISLSTLDQIYFVLSARISENCKKYKLEQGVIKISPKPEQSSMISLIIANKHLINNGK
ncbi:MAG: uroporphyrinogen-III synthase [Pelagibacterales bacterium]|nr:uroporphyrinogen-III synthase [Pelagibacterales bacterium]